MRVKENMFGEFTEATKLKTSLAKYSIEFNDLAVQMRPHRIAYLRLLGRPYTLLYVRRTVGRLVDFLFNKANSFTLFCRTSRSAHVYFYFEMITKLQI